MGKIILLNGPPSSGKDTAAKHIRAWYNEKYYGLGIGNRSFCLLDRMSMPIKRAFAGTMGLPITNDGIVEPWESQKEEIIPELGVSYRQWQIDFSESFLKCYRQEICGELLATRIGRRFSRNIANLIVVPDCGFEIEIEILYARFPPANILLLRCHRDGFDFSNDSRGYVNAPRGCACGDLQNGGDGEYLQLVEAVVKSWLEEPERMPREK